MGRRRATVIDLFCGAGGISVGLRAAGAHILAAVDRDEPAAATFEANLRLLQPRRPPRVLGGDEANLEGCDLAQIRPQHLGPDILVGGPPCQGYSRIGRAKLASLADDPDADDPRNELYLRFIDAARFWRPSAVIMENVPGMRSVRGENVADAVASDLAACGYRVGYALVNAAWYGIPQFRERLFFIGMRDDLGVLPSVPPASHRVDLPSGYLRSPEATTLPLAFIHHFELEVAISRASLPATTVAAALSDLPPIMEHLASIEPRDRPNDFRRWRQYDRDAGTDYARLLRSWPGLPVPEGVPDHVIRRTPRDYETFRRMRPDDRYPDALRIAEQRFSEALEVMRAARTAPTPGSPAYEELRRRIVPPYPVEKFVDKWRKLTPERPSWTVPAHLAKDAYSHVHYDDAQARAISVREAARLQSFPDSFAFQGNMGDCFTQIGNAVPPLLAWVLGAHLLSLLGRHHTPCPLGRNPGDYASGAPVPVTDLSRTA